MVVYAHVRRANMKFGKILTYLTLFAVACLAKPDLNSRADDNGIINIAGRLFQRIVTGKQDHTTVALFSVDAGTMNCEICRLIEPEFKALAYSYKLQHGLDSGIRFVYADFGKNRNLFEQFAIESVPNFWIFKPNTIVPISGDLSSGVSAEKLAALVERETGKGAPIVYRQDPAKKYATLASSILCGAALFFTRKTLLKIFTSRKVWAALSIISVITLSSGFMFTRIRFTPYSQRGANGENLWLAGSQQYQFGAEVQVVSLIYTALTISTIFLAVIAPKVEGAKRQTLFVFFWLIVLWLGYSFLVDVFQRKLQMYPFKLLL
ncbi:oligosaccharyltransferase gamma subunit [Schizosaccharomyces cryophilus OY26]|uniref:Oligosaccharyltransferase gamma subunit n=1 Tax=Schizosaccharomyces cryophilus (strain OY26 / ATCC MYA-4695 / CBS 11777 / NBRC 106824 / NRRL Y48691) TaxID=653667 RepID=S9VSN2_SCHCR|nr:oligosaccharyltransferase gamma subunit [Schizosaccharomyces cryophilus OY26]EPY50893.1 oligosaccharyltransferase gamma subunit [Schizosaccharomyces cryophilus OY26]